MGHPGSAQELREHLECIGPRTRVSQGRLLGTGLIFLKSSCPVKEKRLEKSKTEGSPKEWDLALVERVLTAPGGPGAKPQLPEGAGTSDELLRAVHLEIDGRLRSWGSFEIFGELLAKECLWLSAWGTKWALFTEAWSMGRAKQVLGSWSVFLPRPIPATRRDEGSKS